MTADVQESAEAAGLRVSVSPADGGGTVDGSDPVQLAVLRLVRGTSLALVGKVIAVAGIYPGNPLMTGDSRCSGWR